MRLLLSLFLMLMGLPISAQPLFPCPDTLQQPYGVCTHITRPGMDYEIRDRELNLCQQSGLQWVRSDIDFYNFFSSHDAWDPTKFNNVLQSCNQYNQQYLGILTWLGKLPWDDPQWDSLVRQLAQTFDGRIRYWEVLNEVDLIKNVDNLPEKYAHTQRTAYEVLKAQNPQNVVLTSGFANMPQEYLDLINSQQLWRQFDVFNFHSYFPPEELPTLFLQLHKAMQQGGWERPVWLTECGYHTAKDTTNCQGFFTSLLPAALQRIGLNEQRLTVGVLTDAEHHYNALTPEESDAFLVPFCHRVSSVSFEQLSTINVRKVPILIATRDEYFPAAHMTALVDYVRRGGTIVLWGGMPFYYDGYTASEVWTTRKQLGSSLYERLHMASFNFWEPQAQAAGITVTPTHARVTGQIASNYLWHPTQFSPARYLSDGNLQPGDTLIPLITAGGEQVQKPIAGIYRLNSQLKGNIIFQTRMYTPASTDREAEQARRVARTYLISMAYGISRVFWYNLRSRENNPLYSEDCFGLIHHDFTPKPSMQALQTLIRFCPDGSTRPVLQQQGDLYHASWTTPEGLRMHAYWNPGNRQTFRFPGRIRSVWNHLGEQQKTHGSKFTVGSAVLFIQE